MIRGGYRSRPKADILAEVKTLAAQGVKEFTLIAQDTTRYGTDNGEESQLPQLIEEIAAIPGVGMAARAVLLSGARGRAAAGIR